MRPLPQIAAVAGLVICVGALLFGIFGHPLRDPERPRHRAAVSQIQVFQGAMERYKADCGQYPTPVDGLDALNTNPGVTGWRGPYLVQETPLDPWGNPYQYEYAGGMQRPEVTSYGADGKPGGEFFAADISSRNLKAAVPSSPAEAQARRILIGCTALACVGLLAAFLFWGFAARRDAEDDEGMI